MKILEAPALIDDNVDWTLVEHLLEDAYRSVAPRRAIAALDAMRS